MKTRRQFNIDILKLSDSVHNYEFDINSSFFAEFEDSLIEKGKLKAEVILDKSSTMIQASFQIEGKVELICDRSLEPFDFEISTNNHLIFKYGEDWDELSEEIIMIPRDLGTLNVSQYIYEFIGLAIPMKKLHPRFRVDEDQDEDEEAEATLIYSTQTDVDGETESEETDLEKEKGDENEIQDPRWEILKNIKKNLN